MVFGKSLPEHEVALEGGVRAGVLEQQVFFYGFFLQQVLLLLFGLRPLRVFAVDSGFEHCAIDLVKRVVVVPLRVRFKRLIFIVASWEVFFLSHCCLNLKLFYFLAEMNQNCFTKLLTQLFKMPHCEMDVLMLRTAKRTLQSINVAVF